MAQVDGQNPFANDANGRPLYLQTSYDSEGSPYYLEDYSLAEITAVSGKVYKGIAVKFNLVTNEVLYRSPDGQEMVATINIRRIRFQQPNTENGQVETIIETPGGALNAAGSQVYEVLDSGRCSVLRLVKITVADRKQFNQATITRVFSRKSSFHVMSAGNPVAKLETSRAQMTKLLQDKAAEITAYIDKEGIKCRNVDECRKVIRYYNTLQ